jgi:hypothetical protein
MGYGKLTTSMLAASAVAGGKRRAYWERVMSLNPIAYWPLWEAAGATADDLMNLGDGTYEGVDLGQIGIGDGNTCPLFDTDAVNIYSAALNTNFNRDKGWLMVWAKPLNVGFWTDGADHYVVDLWSVDGYLRVYKPTVSNVLRLQLNNGGTTKERVVVDRMTANWVQVFLTWDKAADEFIPYIDGSKFGPTLTGLGDWSAALNANITCLGSLRRDTKERPWSGWIAHAAIGAGSVLSAQQIQKNHDFIRPTLGIFATGDSKTAGDSWVRILCDNLVTASALGKYWAERPARFGVSGGTCATIKAYWDANIASQWQMPRHIVFNIGTNDIAALPVEATWENQLQEHD